MSQKLTPTIKKKITSDWEKLFPSMGKYKSMWLMNILGPIAVGVLLHVKSANDRYIPTLHIHNLVKDTPVVTLGIEITDNNNYVSTISPEDKYIKIAEKLKEDAVIPYEGDVELSLIISNLKKKAEVGYTYYRVEILTYMAYISSWCGKQEVVDDVFKFIEKLLSTFEEDDFKRSGGREQWFKDLKEKVKDTEKLRETVKKQIVELKLDKIPVRKIIY